MLSLDRPTGQPEWYVVATSAAVVGVTTPFSTAIRQKRWLPLVSQRTRFGTRYEARIR